MNSQFVMGGNKFYIFHLVCQCAKLGLFLKLFLAPYCQLSSNVSSTKANRIGCCLMHLYLHIMYYHEECSNHNWSCESTLILCDFDWKLYECKLRMMTQVCNVLAHFLAFSKSYIHAKAHNMLAIMLDPWFINMKECYMPFCR